MHFKGFRKNVFFFPAFVVACLFSVCFCDTTSPNADVEDTIKPIEVFYAALDNEYTIDKISASSSTAAENKIFFEPDEYSLSPANKLIALEDFFSKVNENLIDFVRDLFKESKIQTTCEEGKDVDVPSNKNVNGFAADAHMATHDIAVNFGFGFLGLSCDNILLVDELISVNKTEFLVEPIVPPTPDPKIKKVSKYTEFLAKVGDKLTVVSHSEQNKDYNPLIDFNTEQNDIKKIFIGPTVSVNLVQEFFKRDKTYFKVFNKFKLLIDNKLYSVDFSNKDSECNLIVMPKDNAKTLESQSCKLHSIKSKSYNLHVGAMNPQKVTITIYSTESSSGMSEIIVINVPNLSKPIYYVQSKNYILDVSTNGFFQQITAGPLLRRENVKLISLDYFFPMPENKGEMKFFIKQANSMDSLPVIATVSVVSKKLSVTFKNDVDAQALAGLYVATDKIVSSPQYQLYFIIIGNQLYGAKYTKEPEKPEDMFNIPPNEDELSKLFVEEV